MKKKLTGILLAVMMLFAIWAGTAAMAGAADPISFTTTTLTGETFDSSSFQNYDLVMINLWAEWCGPCMGELPDLEQIHQEYPNVLLLGAYCGSDSNAALQAAQQEGVTYPLIQKPRVINNYIEINGSGSYSIPQTCFFDRNGNALGSAYVGSRSYSNWKAIVDEKLAEVGSEKPVPVPEPGENLPGDVNEDGVVDGRDVVRLMKYLAGEEEDEETGEPLEINYDSADVDGSGAIDEKDLLRLIRYLGGEKVELLPGAMSGNG